MFSSLRNLKRCATHFFKPTHFCGTNVLRKSQHYENAENIQVWIPVPSHTKILTDKTISTWISEFRARWNISSKFLGILENIERVRIAAQESPSRSANKYFEYIIFINFKTWSWLSSLQDPDCSETKAPK